ncbi:MAG: hypothetical protein ABEJ58_05350 [Halodesulfurarchaeum sp.]
MSTGDDEIPTVRLTCPECGTDASVPITEVADRIDRHNQSIHDGEDVARIDPDVADHLLDLIAEDMGIL